MKFYKYIIILILPAVDFIGRKNSVIVRNTFAKSMATATATTSSARRYDVDNAEEENLKKIENLRQFQHFMNHQNLTIGFLNTRTEIGEFFLSHFAECCHKVWICLYDNQEPSTQRISGLQARMLKIKVFSLKKMIGKPSKKENVIKKDTVYFDGFSKTNS